MLLWKNKGKSNQPFSVLISAKPQWLTLMFFGKRSFGSSVCGHVHLISAKWDSPDRNHDLFWVGTSQNLFAKEVLYAVLTCAVWWGENRGRLTWGWKIPGFRASGAASERCVEVGVTQALLYRICWRFEQASTPALHFCLLNSSWPESCLFFFFFPFAVSTSV